MSDTKKNQLEDELLKLVGRVCDGTILPEEARRLDQMLREHPGLRETYLAYVRLNAELMWRYRTGDAAANTEVTSSATELQSASRTVASAQETTKSFARIPDIRLGSFLNAIVAIAAVFLIALTAFWIGRGRINEPNRGSIIGDGRVAERQRDEAMPVASSFVATLLDASAAVWAGKSEAIDVGARVRPGEIFLETGEAELVFDSGAKLVLSGPARMKLESSLSAFLESGELVAHMPPSAIGFRLRTATAEFIDQGTEFGVVAQRDGASEVHVFRGQVDVRGGPSGAAVELFDGQAMRIEKLDRPGTAIAYSKARFGGLAHRVAAPAQWPVEAGGNGHFYQLIISENPISWHQAAHDSMNLYYRGMPGHLVTVTSREEDQFLVRNVIDDTSTRGIWIGLTDVLRESHFRWVTGEPVEYSNWATFPEQQPDNYQEADWHGGEDYGMYTTFVEDQPWAWNDLSVDSIHEKISAYVVEYEPPIDAIKHRSMTMEPIQWPESAGGNGHHYRLVLSLEPASWEIIRGRASESSFNGSKGHLVVLETQQETEFVVNEILRVCGIPENIIGLSGARETGLNWVNGQNIGDIEVGKPYLPTDNVYGLLRWDHTKSRWGVQTRAMEVQPANWFGYLIEYP